MVLLTNNFVCTLFNTGNHYQSTVPVNHPPAPTMAQLTVHSKEQPSIPVPTIPALPEITKTPPSSKPASPAPIPSNPSTMPAPATPTAPTPIQVTSVTRPPSSQSPQIPVNIISRNDPHTPTTPKNQQPPPQTPPPTTPPSVSAGPITVAAKHAQQQQSQENEQFAYAWLKATFETTPSLASKIEQSEVYKLYLAANAKIGRKAVVPQVHLPRCMRTVFGGTVGPTLIKTTDAKGIESSCYFYEGIKLRPKPPPTPNGGTGAAPKGGLSALMVSRLSGSVYLIE